MFLTICILTACCEKGETPKDDPLSDLSTAVPYFAKLLEDGDDEMFIDGIYPPRLKDYLKETTREQLVDDLRPRAKDMAIGLRQITELKLELKKRKPLLEEFEVQATFTFPDGGKLSFYLRKGRWYGAF
jgi:hypothetical protein